MGIRVVEVEEKEKWADVDKLKPGDTFEDDEGDPFLVTNVGNEDEGMKWLVVKLETGKTSAVEDDERILLTSLILTKEK